MPVSSSHAPARQAGPDASSRSRAKTRLPAGLPTDEARRARLTAEFARVRRESEQRTGHLSAEDQLLQSMTDASPTKWHRAHVTWFFEQFVLGPYVPGHRTFDPAFSLLFNSYYVGAGERHPRPQRGLLSRPSQNDVAAYRAYVDTAVIELIGACSPNDLPDLARIVTLGLHHEQQHQELLVTDILHAFAQSPLSPAYDPLWTMPAIARGGGDATLKEGIRTIGYQPTLDDGDDAEPFAFDNEGPRHRALIGDVHIARSLVTNAEWLEFIAAGGYATPELWLSDGWATVAGEGWQTPGYWRRDGNDWRVMTPGGERDLNPDAPVCHISYYEADAFARWRGAHLPSEFEWEAAAREGLLNEAFGAVWQWTRSAYSPYPGYTPPEGTIGEYNGKFMINQMVLRGSSRATPRGHARISYRNFFYPQQRWQFTGLRLATFPG